MKNELIKIDTPELNGLEKSKAQKIKETFEPMAVMISEFETSFNEILNESNQEITKEVTQKAKRLRIDIGRVRIETGKLKDKQKEYIKLEDKAIMGVHNLLVWAVKEKEDKLKEIENFFEIQEQKRLEELQKERVEKISPYLEDAHERQLSSMEDDVWNAYFQSKKKEHEDRIEAEKKAELERIEREKAEAEERERIRKENEKLRKEAEERERLAKIEAEKRAKEEKARQEKEEAERQAREAKERKEREEYEAKLKAEREAKEKLEREAKQREEEQKAKEEAERQAKEEELKKGDSDKVKDLVKDLESLKSKYSFKSDKYKKLYSDTGILLDKVINHLCK